MKHTSFLKKTAAAALALCAAMSSASVTASARTLVFSGDFDSDGIITSGDAFGVLRCSADNGTLSNTLMKKSDIDRDGEISSNDAVAILRDSIDLELIEQSRSENDAYTVNDGMNDFAAGIFKRSYEAGENTLLSPLSVYTALAMLENGTQGSTRDDMLKMLGGGENSLDEINAYMNDYISKTNGGEFLHTANAMYIQPRDDVDVCSSFINEIKKDYFAEVFSEPAETAVPTINNWVKTNTKGMIDSIVQQGSIKPVTVAILLNAVSFEAKWASQYTQFDIKKMNFNNYDGTTTQTDFLIGEESLYISDELSEGFIKNYSSYTDDHMRLDERYAFVAILPKEGVSVDEYIAQMDDSTIRQLVDSCSYDRCYTQLPKFSYDCQYSMKDSLSDMGMSKAFSSKEADFSSLAKSKYGNSVYVNKVIHKTHIELDENGTKAAAVTAIDMQADCAYMPPEKKVILDRPFVYVIYDMNNNVPAFIGTVCKL